MENQGQQSTGSIYTRMSLKEYIESFKSDPLFLVDVSINVPANFTITKHLVNVLSNSALCNQPWQSHKNF